MVQILRAVFLAITCLFISGTSFAAPDAVEIVNLDDGTRFYEVGGGRLICSLTNRVNSYTEAPVVVEFMFDGSCCQTADAPSEELFRNLFPNVEGRIEVNVHLRATVPLTYYMADDGLLVEKDDEDFLEYNSISWACRQNVTNDTCEDFLRVTQLIIIDADGTVQTLGFSGRLQNRRYMLGSTQGNCTIRPSAGPLTFYLVSYVFEEHDITVKQSEHGTIFAVGEDGTNSQIGDNGIVTVPLGADQTFAVMPDNGYQVARLIVDGEEITPENKLSASYTFTGVREDGHTFSAVFEPYSAADVGADDGVTADIVSMTDSESNPTVAAFEALGFTDGSRAVNIVSADGTEAGGTFAADGFVQVLSVHITYEEGKESGAMTLAVPAPEGGFDAEKSYYVMALNRSTNYYDLWEADPASDRSLNTAGGTVSAYFGSLNVTVEPASAYAPETTFFVYSGTATVTEETPDTPPAGTGGGGASGSGCSAGLSSLALLAFAPMLALRRRP